jgi:hypothetical protein
MNAGDEAFTVIVPDLDLRKSVPGWLRETGTAVRLMLEQSIPYQHNGGSFLQHSPLGGAMLVKVIRKEEADVQPYGELALLAGNPERMFDFAFAWQDSYEVVEGPVAQLYAYYALCKLLPAMRTQKSTAELIDLRKQGQDHFQADNLIKVKVVGGVVQPPELRVFGDFDHKGAVLVEDDRFLVFATCSGLSEDEDHLEATHAANYTLLRLNAAA